MPTDQTASTSYSPHSASARPSCYPSAGNAQEIEAQAMKEVEQEAHRIAVKVAKQRQAMPWWQRLLPFTVTIKRRD